MSSGTTMKSWRLRVNVELPPMRRASERAAQVAAMFGVDGAAGATLYDGLQIEIRPGQIVAVVGPSGAGKSVLLRQARRQCRGVLELDAAALAGSDLSPVDLLAGPLPRRLETLSRCGLADARALTTPARRLSGGQIYRLALAVAVGRAKRRRGPTLILADEFCSSLDELTAEMLCRQVRRMIRPDATPPIALLLATPRAGLLGPLAADAVVVKPLAADAHVVIPSQCDTVTV